MSREIERSGSATERLKSRPNDWRRVRWDGGVFETAYRPMTAVVEGSILSSKHLIMTTLSGGADRHEIATDCGHRYDGPDRPSTFSFLPAGCERRLRLHRVEWRWAAIALDPETVAAESAMSLDELGPVSGLQDAFVCSMLAELDRLDAVDGGLDGTYCETMTHSLLLYLTKRYSRTRSEAARITLPNWRLRRVTEFVASNLAGAIRIADLAQLVQLSEGHFYRAFRATMGRTPLAYIQERRVSVAKDLLGSSELSVAQIALRVGFLSPAHFSRVFREIVGDDPSQYRKSFRL